MTRVMAEIPAYDCETDSVREGAARILTIIIYLMYISLLH